MQYRKIMCVTETVVGPVSYHSMKGNGWAYTLLMTYKCVYYKLT